MLYSKSLGLNPKATLDKRPKGAFGLSQRSTRQSTAPMQERSMNIWLELGAILLVVSLAVGWFQLNQAGYLTFAFGGCWGTFKTMSTGLQVSTIAQQIPGLSSASWISRLKVLINLSYIALGFMALFSVWKLHRRTLKYVATALLVVFAANLATTYFQGATFSSWFAITPSILYVKSGDFLMGLAVLILLVESFKTKEEAMFIVPPKRTEIGASTQVSRVVRCHICPLRDVCREANVEASLKLEHPHGAGLGEDPYGEMLRVTMNCPLKKNI
jgi:hypothetical protein